MRYQVARAVALGFCLLVLVTIVRGQDALAPMDETYAIPPLVILPPVRVTAAELDGTIRLEPVSGQPQVQFPWWQTTEGHYLIMSRPVLSGEATGGRPRKLDCVVRVEVVDVGERNFLTARSSPEAAQAMKVGDVVALVRPARMTTLQMRALPAVIPLVKEGGPRAPGNLSDDLARARKAAELEQSVNHLKLMGLALHNFHSAYGNFPPAIVYGPDGKPWHSWRVLILPFVEETPTYNQYDFTQPWDSPKNRALIEKMPAVYRDPINGETTGSDTHYAALVGEKTLFSPQGSTIQIANGSASDSLFKGRRINEITDGTSNTIAIVPVDPARKIPWTKPEDIPVGDDFPGLGRPGGIFTPTRMDGAGVVPVLFVDGSVRSLSNKTDVATIRALATINGGEILSKDSLRDPAGPRAPGRRPQPTLHLIRQGNKVSAMIDWAPASRRLSPGEE